jgi:carboxyl-terminal processing protease
MIEGGIGYIRLVEFRAGAAKELKTALRKLQGEGMKGLILDLRNNPGGLLEEGVAVASEFLPEGKLIVYTRGRTAGSNHDFFARNPDYTKIPLVLLVNGFSASASEILSGAIQDWKRGIIIGTKTYGKASVQTVIPLGDGSALRLTTAKYFTPKGRNIHKTKIIPDIIVKERKERGGISLSPPGIPPNKVKGKEPGKKKSISDPQLKEAVNILKAWPIFKSIYSLEENTNAK